jgi:hypothetical protein
MKRFLICLCFAAAACPLFSQTPENINIGIYGRGESNLYRYYGGTALGNFYTKRVNNSYSTGLSLHASVNYLFNAAISFGFSEANYRPDILAQNSQLYMASIRMWHLNMAGELKFNDKPLFNPTLILGFQAMFKESSNEKFSAGVVEELLWPRTRMMPQIGIGFQYTPRKTRLNLRAEAGLRLNSINRTGYDYGLNQAFAGLHLMYRVKSW